MNKLTHWIKDHQITTFFNLTFASRLGGIAGLLGVALGLMLGFGLVIPIPAIQKTLQVLNNLAVVVWLVGIAAIQSPRLGRLGSLGLGAAIAGLSAITVFNSGDWVSALLASPAMPLVFTVVAVLFVWGILALGTTSLQTGVLPRGAVVLWMVGLMARLITSWPPVLFVAIAGILWSSIVLLRGTPVKDASYQPDVMPVVRTSFFYVLHLFLIRRAGLFADA